MRFYSTVGAHLLWP